MGVRNMTTIINAYTHPDLARFLWKLMEESLDEPHTTIAHKAMPTWAEHLAFLERRTYVNLLLLTDELPDTDGTMLVGYVGVTKANEIGIRIRKGYRGKGYGHEAIAYVLDHLRPVPGVGIAPHQFVANINPKNAASIALFTKLGFTLHGATHEQLVYVSPMYQREENRHGQGQPEGSSTA